MRRSGESDDALWERYLAFRQRGSVSTEPGLRQIALDIPNVTDIGFTPQNNGSMNVYIVSTETVSGELPGTSTAALRTQVSDALNDISVKNITDQFNVVEPTITQFTILYSLWYVKGLSSTVQLQNDLATATQAYVAEARGFGQKKPAQGHFLDSGALTQRLVAVPNVVRVQAPVFILAGEDARDADMYKAGIDNGFYSMAGEVHFNPASTQSGAINITLTEQA